MTRRKHYRLRDLLAGMTTENRRGEISFGLPVGREYGAPDAADGASCASTTEPLNRSGMTP